MKPNITTIPATLTSQRQNLFDTSKKRRTAAYARVSTDTDEQETSFTAQVEFYTKKITGNPEWEFVEVYTDVDTTYGQNAKARE